MFSFLQPKEAKSSVPQSMIMNLYYKYRFQSLLGIFIGYAAYYIVRNNFALSTHFLSDILHMSKSCKIYGFRSYLLCNYQHFYELCRQPRLLLSISSS